MKVIAFIVLIILTLAGNSCNLIQDSEILPVPLLLSTFGSRDVTLQIDEALPTAEFYYPIFGGLPISGLKQDKVTWGQIVSAQVFGNQASLKTERTNNRGEVIYNCVFADEESYFTIRFNNDKTFCYEQFIVYKVLQDPLSGPSEPGYVALKNLVEGEWADNSLQGSGFSAWMFLDTMEVMVSRTHFSAGRDYFGIYIDAQITETLPTAAARNEIEGILDASIQNPELSGHESYTILVNDAGEWKDIYENTDAIWNEFLSR